MPGMFHNNVSSDESAGGYRFSATACTSRAVYWIIAIGSVLLLGATLLRRLNTFNLSREGFSRAARADLPCAWPSGCIWVFDGILQFQPGDAARSRQRRGQPTVAGRAELAAPAETHAIHLWNAHPISLATGTAWIQIGIGLALIVSNAGTVGVASRSLAAGWAALIWLVGNGAGGAFAQAVHSFWLARCNASSTSSRPYGSHYLPNTSLSTSRRFVLRLVALVLAIAGDAAGSSVGGVLARRQHQRADGHGANNDRDRPAARSGVDRASRRRRSRAPSVGDST